MSNVTKVFVSLRSDGYPEFQNRGFSRKLLRVAIGVFATPFYLFGAFLVGGPGIRFHLETAMRALKLSWSGFSLRKVFQLVFFPMDSFRYFEFDFFWKCFLRNRALGVYLDVSSPRLFVWRALLESGADRSILINPDSKDLNETRALFERSRLLEKCALRSDRVSALTEPDQTFDTITCISVLEHIPEEESIAALSKLWKLLRSGGRLWLSVPCARDGYEEHLDFNEYGLLSSDENGFVFGQRFYDVGMIEDHIYKVTGKPANFAVFGELEEGIFRKNRLRKLWDQKYPFWKEAWMMAREFRNYHHINELPGAGVIAFEFIKP